MLHRRFAGSFTFCHGWLLAAIFFLAFASGAPSASFSFAWLSDTHVGSANADDDLLASVHDINSQTGLSFVVVSGDITEYGSEEQLKKAREILGALKIPFHTIPGNHDTKWSESGATDFPRIFGADRFVFEHAGYRFIGMHQGPLMKMGDGHWAPQDVRWLREQLAATPPQQPIVFITHYPIDDGIANWFVVLDLLKAHNTQVVLCGHGHASRGMLFEGIPGVMGRSNLRARQAVGGYNVVELQGERMTFAERVPTGETKPPWHTVELRQRAVAADTNQYPRPDYSLNHVYSQVRQEWVVNTGFTISSSPAVAEKLAFVGDASGVIRALDVRDGHEKWRFKTGGAVYSTPAVSAGLVVCGSTDGSIYALKASSGRKAWAVATLRPIVACPVIANGTVFIGSSEGTFRALDLKTGKTRWEYTGVQGFVETRPLVYQHRIIFGSWGQRLYALEAKSGALAWSWKGDKAGALLSPAACWPVGAQGRVFIVAPDRMLTAIDATSGAQIWRSGEHVVRETIGLSQDASRIYVRDMNNYFRAFSTTGDTPVKLWEANAGFGYDINSAMMIEKDGVVFYGTKNDVLYALEGTTGKVLWAHKLGTGVMNTVAPLSASEVLVTDFDGRVALIKAGNR
jgi:outer membrane protein assembly factor BamB/predicted phosphodiesterase